MSDLELRVMFWILVTTSVLSLVVATVTGVLGIVELLKLHEAINRVASCTIM